MKNSMIPLLVLLAFYIIMPANAQPRYDYSEPFICTSQLGFRPGSEKLLTLVPGVEDEKLPDNIPFYIVRVAYQLPRSQEVPEEWNVEGNVFRWPFDKLEGELKADEGRSYYSGNLTRISSRWGEFWQGNFSDFVEEGLYQIETQYGTTVPFVIEEDPYEKLERSYLEYIYSQRSGVELPGIRKKDNADDAVLSSDSSYYLPVAGGWYNAGDWRKWLSLTQGNIEALSHIIRYGHPDFSRAAREEIRWGNQYFHQMINDSGRVYEDVGGGYNRAGDYDNTWWNENHPGVTATGANIPDNIPMNGDEREVRDKYNPLVQFLFVRNQSLASQVLDGPDKSNCLVLADRAWNFGQKTGHDHRTIFISEELLAALELYAAGGPSVTIERIEELLKEVLDRQEVGNYPLTGYFMEKNKTDGYRSIAFPAEPAMALTRFYETRIPELKTFYPTVKEAITRYVDDYLLKDAASNPFGIPPYGIYTDPPFPDRQTFREAGKDRYVRTFVHVFSENPMPHGTNGNLLQRAYLLSRAGKILDRPDWQMHAEKILQWSTGHNPAGLCLFTGIGFKHPVPASYFLYKIPSGALNGFLGRPDDTPYLETTNMVEWSTQEVWDVPFYYTVGLISYLK